MTDILETTEETIIVVTEEGPIEILTEGIQGPPGPEYSSRIIGVYTAGETMGGHRAVQLDHLLEARYVSSDELGHAGRLVGVTTGAAEAGEEVTVHSFGPITEPTWNWNTLLPVFVGVNGILTQTPPTIGFTQVIGFPLSPVMLFVNIGVPLILE